MSPEEFIKRPELLLGPNPFVEAGAEYIPFVKLPEKLIRMPLRGKDWRSIPPWAREPLLQEIVGHFVPHRGILAPAADLQALFRAGS